MKKLNLSSSKDEMNEQSWPEPRFIWFQTIELRHFALPCPALLWAIMDIHSQGIKTRGRKETAKLLGVGQEARP